MVLGLMFLLPFLLLLLLLLLPLLLSTRRWRGEGRGGVRAVAPEERCLDEGGAGEEKEEETAAGRFSGTSDAMKKSRSAQGVTPGGDVSPLFF